MKMANKYTYGILCLLLIIVLCITTVTPASYYSFPGYGRDNRRISYGRNYKGNGGLRYSDICNIHAVQHLAWPGQVGSPVCPYN